MTNHYEECDFCGELRHRGEKCNPKARNEHERAMRTAENHVRQKRKREAEELLALLLELPLKERQKLLK